MALNCSRRGKVTWSCRERERVHISADWIKLNFYAAPCTPFDYRALGNSLHGEYISIMSLVVRSQLLQFSLSRSNIAAVCVIGAIRVYRLNGTREQLMHRERASFTPYHRAAVKPLDNSISWSNLASGITFAAHDFKAMLEIRDPRLYIYMRKPRLYSMLLCNISWFIYNKCVYAWFIAAEDENREKSLLSDTHMRLSISAEQCSLARAIG